MAILQTLRALAAILLLPVLVPLAMIRDLFNKGREITPAEFAALLRRIADDLVDRGEWDEFECVALRDKRLEDIRRRSFPFCGRPGIVDEKALYVLAAESEALPPLIG